MLPHAYPFRLVERAAGPTGEPLLAWTVDAALGRGAAAMPAVLALEMMAQSALLALPPPEDLPVGAGEPPMGLLAGADAVRFSAPVAPGDRLVARAELVGRFGRLVKARVTLSRLAPGGAGAAGTEPAETVAEGELLLALEG